MDAIEVATNHFYSWEARGRGWINASSPIQIEPPFYPFFGHPNPNISKKDTGKKSLLEWVGFDFSKEKKAREYYQEPIEPFSYDHDEDLRFLKIQIPKYHKGAPLEMNALLVMLTGSSFPISFEIIADSKSIVIQIVSRESDFRLVTGSIKAYFPDVRIIEHEDFVITALSECEYLDIKEYALKHEFTRPIVTGKKPIIDPYIPLLGLCEELSKGESIIIQILFQGTVNSWAESIISSVTNSYGESFFSDDPDMLPLANEKVSSPITAVTIKIVCGAISNTETTALGKRTEMTFGRIYNGTSNSLIHIPPEIPSGVLFDDIILRQSHRLGMLLNISELGSLVHFPETQKVSSKLSDTGRLTRKVPEEFEGNDFVLGINEHFGKRYSVSLSENIRHTHTHVIGATGTGKSTLLHSMIMQDIERGNGLCVIDPHGDLIDSILGCIPNERIKDCIVIDPSDSEYPVGFNILKAHSEIEKNMLSSDLVAVFRRLSTSWGDQMNSVFANAILCMLESNTSPTLIELRRFLVEKDFREKFLETVNDESIVYYWRREFPLLRSGSIGPILTRLDSFLRPKIVRNMVSQKKGLDFESIVRGNKILLVKLSQGLIGEENSYLLGTFLATKLYQTAFGQQAKARTERSKFYLYIDEFHNFITPSLTSILSGGRKYNMGLILSHQDMSQLAKYDSEMASMVLSSTGTRICFRVGDADAKRFETGFSHFERSDLENLETGQAIVRIGKPDNDFTLETIPVDIKDSKIFEETKQQVIISSRNQYASLLNEIVPTPLLKDQTPTKTPIVQFPLKEITHTKEILDPTSKEVLEKRSNDNQHRYLQMFIKKMAEQRGFVARLEEPTADGKGRVDISLEKQGKKIAIEVARTTETAWEIHNLKKCLQANYDVVISCSETRSTLDAIQKMATEVLDDDMEKLKFFETKELTYFLDQMINQDSSTETRVKGYRVKVAYTTMSQKEVQLKNGVISKVLLSKK